MLADFVSPPAQRHLRRAGPGSRGNANGTAGRGVDPRLGRPVQCLLNQGEDGMQLNIRLAAAGLALIFAGSTAQGFVLEPKGPAAKWRTDIVKRNNKYTTCILNAWNKCEAKANSDGQGTQGLECQIDADPVTAIAPWTDSSGFLVTTNAAIDKCDAILAEADDVSDPLKPKGKGLNAANKLTINGGLKLRDIGCLGDCSSADGTQACASVAAWKTTAIDSTSNIRSTAATIGGGLGPVLCGTDPDPGAASVALTAGVIKYVSGASACVQKCQDDFAAKSGNGFFNDTTACLLNRLGDGALIPLGDGVAFDTCVVKANAAITKLGASNTCGFPGAAVGLMPLLSGLVNATNNSNYDRVDLEAGFIGGLIGGLAPALVSFCAAPGVPLACCTGPGTGPTCAASAGLQAASLGGRASPGTPVAFATCASFGDGAMTDFEECDVEPGGGSLVSVCPSIPGTVAQITAAGNAACVSAGQPLDCCTGPGAGTCVPSANPNANCGGFAGPEPACCAGSQCGVCPTADNDLVGVAAGRCNRPRP